MSEAPISAAMLICSAESSSTTSSSRTRGAMNSWMRVNTDCSPSTVDGLVMNENAPRSRPYWRSSSTVSTCTGMWRVAGSCLS